jgi:hypothetical protein
MPVPEPTPPSGRHPGESNLARSYTAVVLVEIAVLAALYWLGRHFG